MHILEDDVAKHCAHLWQANSYLLIWRVGIYYEKMPDYKTLSFERPQPNPLMSTSHVTLANETQPITSTGTLEAKYLN